MTLSTGTHFTFEETGAGGKLSDQPEDVRQTQQSGAWGPQQAESGATASPSTTPTWGLQGCWTSRQRGDLGSGFCSDLQLRHPSPLNLNFFTNKTGQIILPVPSSKLL